MHSYLKLFCLSTVFVLSACSDRTQVFSSNASATPKQSTAKSGGYYKIGNPYQVSGVWYYPKEDYNHKEVGVASWYGADFHNGITANGELYDMHALTAAHRTLPLPSIVRVTNLQNNRSLLLRVNDRGPFANDRVIDVSMYAAQMLGFKEQGTVQVQVEIMPEESKQLKAELLKQGSATAAGLSALDEKAVQNVETNELQTLKPLDSRYPRLANSRPSAAVPLIPLATKPSPSAYNDWDEDISQAQAKKTAYKSPAAPAVVKTETVIVAKPKPTPAPVTQVVPSTVIAAGYYIQVGAFGSLENATKMKDKVSVYGKSLILPVSVNGKTLYRVRIGPESAKKALAVMDDITRNGYPDARLVEEKGSVGAGQRLNKAF